MVLISNLSRKNRTCFEGKLLYQHMNHMNVHEMTLSRIGISFVFPPYFTKGNNYDDFLFASLDEPCLHVKRSQC